MGPNRYCKAAALEREVFERVVFLFCLFAVTILWTIYVDAQTLLPMLRALSIS